MISFFQAIILGLIQGLTEWLPVSSEGISSIVMIAFFKKTLAEAISITIWLHLGTLLASIVFFRKELWEIIRTAPNTIKNIKSTYNNSLLVFIIVSTIGTGILGVPIWFLSINKFVFFGEQAMAMVGIFLLITGLMQYRAHKKNMPGAAVAAQKLAISDGFFVGLAQAFSAMPGLSRSGITTSYLLMRRYPGKQALRLSFLISIPVILLAQILLKIKGEIVFNYNSLVALVISFVIGFLTIKILLGFASKINFAYVLFFIGTLSILPVILRFLF